MDMTSTTFKTSSEDEKINDPETDKIEKDEVKTVKEETDEYLDAPYTETKTVTIGLIQNYSLYRKANDKVLPKRRDFIGSSVRSSLVLSSNRAEIEAYFPQLVGVSPNHDTFLTRVKQYLNNIQVHVDELGVTFDCSFIYTKKRYYYDFKKREDKIEEDYKRANKQNIQDLKKALEFKISAINNLESEKYAFGSPVNIADYILYRHCLLYRDIAKDTAIINSDPHIRLYFRDDAKEKELKNKLRLAVNIAKTNYVAIIGDDELFDAVYTQYCVLENLPVVNSLLNERVDKEIQLDKFSINEPVKFNSIVNDKDIKVRALIETLISKGDLIRSQWNQNITTANGEFIGANMKEAIAWAKDPNNEPVVTSFKNKLKYS